MTKKAGKFASVYRKASESFKRGQGTDPEVIKPPEGWAQREVDFLSTNPPEPDQKVSYSHETSSEKVKTPAEPKVKGKK